MPELITLDIFKNAIMNSMKTPAMREQAAVGLAEHVLNFFGFQDRIIDNMLEPEDRDAFYMLEDVGLLTTEREETGLPDGREWRIHYWVMREDKIMRALKLRERKQYKADDSVETVYDTIPDDIWFRRTAKEEEEEEEEEEELDEADWEIPIKPGSIRPIGPPAEQEDDEGEEIKLVSEESIDEEEEE